MSYITLTLIGGNQVTVNAESVLYIVDVSGDSKIVFTDGKSLLVQETRDYIQKQCNLM